MKALWKSFPLFYTEKSILINSMQRRKRNLISDINVVPYIDVMLVLLVIFMIAAPLMVQGVLVNLPEASADPLPVRKSEPLIVSIKDNGAVYLEVESLGGQELNLKELNQNVSKLLEADPTLQIVIRGDSKVLYEKVMIIMAELQRVGAQDIGLITKPPSRQK
jgi:biopolymer transport protein TolR